MGPSATWSYHKGWTSRGPSRSIQRRGETLQLQLWPLTGRGELFGSREGWGVCACFLGCIQLNAALLSLQARGILAEQQDSGVEG